jgi:hypothetical protein
MTAAPPATKRADTSLTGSGKLNKRRAFTPTSYGPIPDQTTRESADPRRAWLPGDMTKSPVLRLSGTISSVAFETGDRFVIGSWDESPIGAFDDVMWARPDGSTVLVASGAAVRDFVCGIYSFDEVIVAPLVVQRDRTRTIDVTLRSDATRLDLSLRAGRSGGAIPFRRPLWFTRWIEGPVARITMGVRTYGVSPTGVAEWYQARSWRWVTAASGRLDGIDLGPVGRFERPCGFGFSDPPRRPAIVSVRPALSPPGGEPLEVVGPVERLGEGLELVRGDRGEVGRPFVDLGGPTAGLHLDPDGDQQDAHPVVDRLDEAGAAGGTAHGDRGPVGVFVDAQHDVFDPDVGGPASGTRRGDEGRHVHLPGDVRLPSSPSAGGGHG